MATLIRGWIGVRLSISTRGLVERSLALPSCTGCARAYSPSRPSRTSQRNDALGKAQTEAGRLNCRPGYRGARLRLPALNDHLDASADRARSMVPAEIRCSAQGRSNLCRVGKRGHVERGYDTFVTDWPLMRSNEVVYSLSHKHALICQRCNQRWGRRRYA